MKADGYEVLEEPKDYFATWTTDSKWLDQQFRGYEG